MPAAQIRKFGKYTIIGKIASGGMGELLKAKISGEFGFEKILAIKKIHPHFATEQEMLTAFIDEARLAAQLQHQNIVQIVDFGSVNADYFMAMEYLEGYDLRTFLNLAASAHRPLDIAHALLIAQKVCEGLQYAHTLTDKAGRPLGIIHRDISPANVFITTGGEVKIIDFGISRAASHSRLTTAGSLMGKLPYMAPEQARSEAIDHRIDIYAVGAVLYETLTGRRLFEGDGFGLIERIKEGSFVPPAQAFPGQGEDLYRILDRSLATDPAQRYQSCAAMIDDIEAYLTSHGLRPSSRTLREYFEHLPMEREAGARAAADPEKTEVCDVFAATASPKPENKPSPRRQGLGGVQGLAIQFFREYRRHLAITAAACLVVLVLFLVFRGKYTAFNLWIPADSNLSSVNYKGRGALLPAGTPIHDIKVGKESNLISFTTDDARRIVIQFEPKWHPGRTVEDFADELVTTKNFAKLTAGMDEAEVAAIKSGVLKAGMSKDAVLVDYGPPPESGTASTAANQWTYWYSRFGNRTVCFDEKELLMPSCPDDLGKHGKGLIKGLGSKILDLIGE